MQVLIVFKHFVQVKLNNLEKIRLVQQHLSKCTNGFRKSVKKIQDFKAYKGTEHAYDDFNYCMRTHQNGRAINECQTKHCFKKNLICINIDIENLETIIA